MPNTMSIEATWQEGFRFEAHTGSGHDLTLDASVEVGGGDAGARPIELLLVANATCMGMDVVSILRKMRQEVTGYRVRVTGERAPEHPMIFTRILLEHFVTGNVEASKLAHAIKLSEEKYCSVGAMLGKAAKIETRFEILPGEG